jgi:hypothetical protein
MGGRSETYMYIKCMNIIIKSSVLFVGHFSGAARHLVITIVSRMTRKLIRLNV